MLPGMYMEKKEDKERSRDGRMRTEGVDDGDDEGEIDYMSDAFLKQMEEVEAKEREGYSREIISHIDSLIY